MGRQCPSNYQDLHLFHSSTLITACIVQGTAISSITFPNLVLPDLLDHNPEYALAKLIGNSESCSPVSIVQSFPDWENLPQYLLTEDNPWTQLILSSWDFGEKLDSLPASPVHSFQKCYIMCTLPQLHYLTPSQTKLCFPYQLLLFHQYPPPHHVVSPYVSFCFTIIGCSCSSGVSRCPLREVAANDK